MSSIHPEPAELPGPLVEAWRADLASPAELRRGYARFIRRRPAGGAWRGLLRLVAVGLVLGVGLAQAASLAQKRWFGQRELESAPHGQHGSKKKPALPVPRQRPAPVASSSAAPSEEAPPLASAGPARPTSAPAPTFVQEQWQRAATALRDHDFVAAESAFIQIERSVGGAEGDAARLARAQLLASYGRSAEARALASDLQEHAQSALVRDKARALSTRLSKIDTPDRSSTPSPAINQP